MMRLLCGRKRIFYLFICLGCFQIVYLIYVGVWKPTMLISYWNDSYSGELGKGGLAVRSDLLSVTRRVAASLPPIDSRSGFLRANVFREYFNLKLSYDIKRARRKCRENTTYAVAAIDSAPENVERRQAIRQTWAAEDYGDRLGVVTLFVMGYTDDANLMSSVDEEQRRYGDILMGNFVSSMRNNTLNSLLTLKWTTSVCPAAQFVFFGNDRMIYVFDVLVHQLQTFTKEETINMWYGRRIGHTTPDRNPYSVYFVSKNLYPGLDYPDVCSWRAGHVLSMTSAQTILKHSWRQPLLPMPEVFLGTIARRLPIVISHDDRFTIGEDAFKYSCGIVNSFTVSAPSSVPVLQNIWREIQDVTFRRSCPDPDINAVIATQVNNTAYIKTVLAPVLEHRDSCSNSSRQPENIFLVALVSTHPENMKRRNVIRETWGAQKTVLGEIIRVLFIMGSSLVNNTQENVKKEDEQYGDIIQATFIDSFKNLTLKVVLGLKWMSENCPSAKYMYKGDDDMFVNFENIIKDIKSRWPISLTKFYMGSKLYRSVRIDDPTSKYYVPETIYRGRFYPPYCSGGGYIVSNDVIPKLFRMTKTTQFIPIDDAYQGILMKAIGVPTVNNDMFKNWGYNSDPCSLRKALVVHFHSPEEKIRLRELWHNFKKPLEC